MKKMPTMTTDEQAEQFLEQDLSDLDFRQFQPMQFEMAPKDTTLNMRLPAPLLAAVKARAAAKKIPYTRYIRMLLESDVAQPDK
ncbi:MULTISPECIES: CopG family antitoxin [Acidithiobacillaceae]|jgi:predicted DNA binding CopG/RHH family protein|uniref:Uncharacterized protein n=1 Tax=Igneacidithiobacillus copahuensis TaxID=2724909 RepID=A0AAE2YNS4_9PROT|nr:MULTISPECIES: CopG family antitoxin [Acidithiobacillaceae]MBU2763389.1 hypothetical protein [Acidithiobacillus caldus]MBU2771228.1 hypothetical protein [Acidithiobacillus caldus]MBU2787226.1 hypothetical protein [Igneacidithiobacillus copahuensis]MBU2797543.1 hypothetical protein [Acidithiobacillus sp. VAN18-2]